MDSYLSFFFSSSLDAFMGFNTFGKNKNVLTHDAYYNYYINTRIIFVGCVSFIVIHILNLLYNR